MGVSLSPTSPLGLVALLLFTLALLALFSRSQRTPSRTAKKSKSTRTIVLTGPLAAGKTALFSKLLYGHAPATHTSMKENEGLIKRKWLTESAGEKAELALDSTEKVAPAQTQAVALSRPLQVIDTPGHARLRARALASFVPAADALVFVVDAAQGLSGPRIREAGEHLHLLLSLLALLPAPPPLLILLAKSDLIPATASSTPAATQAKALERAKLSLARELERRRATSTNSGAGARLEGLEAPVGGAPSSGSLLMKIWEVIVGGGNSSGAVESAAVSLPSDEAEILAAEAFPFEGTFAWDKLDLDVQWATASIKGHQGVEQLWEFVDRL